MPRWSPAGFVALLALIASLPTSGADDPAPLAPDACIHNDHLNDTLGPASAYLSDSSCRAAYCATVMVNGALGPDCQGLAVTPGGNELFLRAVWTPVIVQSSWLLQVGANGDVCVERRGGPFPDTGIIGEFLAAGTEQSASSPSVAVVTCQMLGATTWQAWACMADNEGNCTNLAAGSEGTLVLYAGYAGPV